MNGLRMKNKLNAVQLFLKNSTFETIHRQLLSDFISLTENP